MTQVFHSLNALIAACQQRGIYCGTKSRDELARELAGAMQEGVELSFNTVSVTSGSFDEIEAARQKRNKIDADIQARDETQHRADKDDLARDRQRGRLRS